MYEREAELTGQEQEAFRLDTAVEIREFDGVEADVEVFAVLVYQGALAFQLRSGIKIE